MSQTNALVPGSISAIARQSNIGIAEAFLGADAIAIVDVSGSMNARDSRGGRRRIDVAIDELRQIQANLPGKVAVVAFSDDAWFVPGGVPPDPVAGTDLAAALRFVHVADGTIRFIVISDGQPDDEQEALAEARRFISPIDCVFVGAERDTAARRFLEQLTRTSGGRYVAANQVDQLAARVERLMLTAGR